MGDECVFCPDGTMEYVTGVYMEEKLDSPKPRGAVRLLKGELSVDNATWIECADCGERLLPPKLARQIHALRVMT